jgi:hypothetical protein
MFAESSHEATNPKPSLQASGSKIDEFGPVQRSFMPIPDRSAIRMPGHPASASKATAAAVGAAFHEDAR